MIMNKHVIQLGDLILSGAGVKVRSEFSGANKFETEDITNYHGSYYTTPQFLYSEPQSVDLNITFDTRIMFRDQVRFLVPFIKKTLSQENYLWVVDCGKLLYTRAIVSSWSNTTTDSLLVQFSMNLELPEGIWHYANPYTTFVLPYNWCSFADCLGYRNVNACNRDDKGECIACACECALYGEETSLCARYGDLIDSLNEYCPQPFKIAVSCEKGRKLWCRDNWLGIKHKANHPYVGYIIFKEYIDTTIPTDDYTLYLFGAFTSEVRAEINGNVYTVTLPEEGIRGELAFDGSTGQWYLNNELVPPMNVTVSANYITRLEQGVATISINGFCCDIYCDKMAYLVYNGMDI